MHALHQLQWKSRNLPAGMPVVVVADTGIGQYCVRLRFQARLQAEQMIAVINIVARQVSDEGRFGFGNAFIQGMAQPLVFWQR